MKEKDILLLRIVQKLENKGLLDQKVVKKNLRPRLIKEITIALTAGILLR